MEQKTIGYLLTAFSLVLVIVLLFVKFEFDKQSAFLCKVVEADPNVSMEECPAHEDTTTTWLLTGAIGAGFLLMGAGLYISFLLSPKKSGQETKHEKSYNKKEIDTSLLDAEEKAVCELIKGQGGSCYQSDIIRQTGFSKVKVSRILDKLESKEIVERKRRGMTNIVVLR